MQLNPEFETPSPPHIRSRRGSEDEVPVDSLTANLSSMENQCRSVVADVALFEFCIREPDAHLREWPFLAGRDGAMSLRNYKEAMSTVRGLLGRCPSISDDVDAKMLKEAERTFDLHFPRAEKLRHSVAHPEHYSNPKIKMSTDEAISKPGAQIPPGSIIQGALIGRTFVCTINGLTVEWEISYRSALALVDITRSAFAAFAKFYPVRHFADVSQPRSD